MKVWRRIVKMIAICCMCNMASHAEQRNGVDSAGTSEEATVTLELTRLVVTGSSLELTYTIRNGLDRDVWICSEAGAIPYEMYLTQDKQTLLIRKRLDVPSSMIWRTSPHPGTYVRLKTGAIRPESLVIDLPAKQQSTYASIGGEVVTQRASRLVLEIGYYDEDLPALIRGICAVADQLSGKGWELGYGLGTDALKTYFRGLIVRGNFVGSDVLKDEPYTKDYLSVQYSGQALTGEKVLRLETKGVSIPYKGGIGVDARGASQGQP
jgi:hypothetical protein